MEVVQSPVKATNQKAFEKRKEELEKQKKEEEEQKKRERQSPFKSFYQVNKANSEHLRICLKENPKALEMLLFLFDNMDRFNAVVCSYKVFEEVLKIKRTRIGECIRYLKEKGFIYVYKSGTSNVYVANNNLVWSSWGTNTKYCQFPASVVLSSSEQEGMTEKEKNLREEMTEDEKKLRKIRLQAVEIKERGEEDEQPQGE